MEYWNGIAIRRLYSYIKWKNVGKIQNIFQQIEFNRHLFLSTNDYEEGTLKVAFSTTLIQLFPKVHSKLFNEYLIGIGMIGGQ